MKKIFFLLLTILTGTSIFAQQGKDGAPNITVTTTVNIYTPLASNASANTTTISVVSAVGFSAGDLIYIIQMQGATVKAYSYQFGNPNAGIPNDTSFGKISSYNGSGNNEFAEIASVSGNILTLDCALKDSFGIAGKTQIIRVPRYSSLTLSLAGQITCPTWNGSTGGVVVVEVQGNTTIGSGTSFNVSGKGFRGGAVLNATNFTATNVGYNYTTHNGARKGESIVGDTILYNKQTAGNYNGGTAFWLSTPMATCKGNVANGGGGGNAMNCGGGGGSNGGVIAQWNGMGNTNGAYAAIWGLESIVPASGTVRPTSSSGGGRGGYAFSGNDADPTLYGPNDLTHWGSDNRHNDGGWGGLALDYSTGKIFLGGGGGAGDENDNSGTSGANGGGIVYLVSYGTVTGAGQILADGATAASTNSIGGSTKGDDGAGGGGGGGAVFINSTGNIALTNTLAISAQGGVGGSYIARNAVTTPKNFGPGGGGGGGYVATTNVVAGTNVNGGANGVSFKNGINNTKIANNFPPNGATSGGAGSIATSVAPFYLTTTNYTVCPSSAVSLSVTVNGTVPSGLAISWFTVSTGGTAVSNSNPYGITAPAAAGTYTYYAGTCPGTYRLPLLVTVNSSVAPTLSVSATNTNVCSGTPVTLTVSGATSYTWGANAGNATTNTVTVSPNANTTYTVTGATSGACAGTNTISININASTPPTITITPTSYSICSGINDTLKATGATSYTWSANAVSATTSSVVVLPNTLGATTYSVTGVTGACTSTQSVIINVTATPTVSVSPTNTYICKGANTTFTASGATTYSWSTSATTSTISVSPSSNTTYTVTGNNGNCADAKTILVKVDAGITKADSISNAATCGQSNGSYVLNSVTGGISPYQINFNGTGFSNIAAFSYTVPALAGNSYPIILKDSLGCTYTSSVTIGNTSGITKVDSSTTNCNASVGIININSITGGTASYQVNIDGGTFNTIISFPYSFTNLAVGTHTVMVKDASGCPHTSLIQVNSNGGPSSVATSTVQADTCGKNVGTITVGAVTGGTTPYQYSIDGVTYQTTNTFTALPTNTYTLYVKDNTGCSITSTATVSSISGPTSASVTPVADTCNKHVGAIVVSQITGGTSPYTYALNNGTYQTASTFTALSASTYTIQVKDNSGCIYTVTPNTTVVSIISVTTPTIAASGSTTFCNGGSITLTSSSASSYTWSTGVNTQTITVSTAGIYTVNTTSPTGCTSSDTITIKINPNPTTPTINDTTVSECSNSIQQIHFNHSTGLLIIHNSAGQLQSIPFTPSVSGIYTAYDSLNGCTSSVKNITVNINAAPAVVPTVTTPVIYCQGQIADTLKAIATTVGADLVWQDANHNTILTPPTPTPLTGLAGTTTYYVYQSIGVCNGPIDSIKVFVVGKPNPNFTINPATDIFVGQTIAFTPVQTTTTNTYYWNFLDPTSGTSNTSTSSLPTHAYNTADSYCPKLVVTNQAGCKDSTTLCLDVLSNISMIIPNVFSPNGDGLNDVFSVKATGYTNFTCDIFDRWGLKLYSWTGVSGYWDGTEKTSKAVDGTYFYVIQTTDVKGEDHKYNGFIQLVK